MTRAGWQLRDAAVGYASRGIPVLPLHYPLPRRGLQPVPGDQHPAVSRTGCSCRDPGCGQPGKHPLGSLVPHGVKDATTNRARVLAWWSRHPLANIGLACGHVFDVLDVDGPVGEATIRALAAAHGLVSSGPLVRTGGGGWHYYLAPTGLGNVRPAGLAHVDWRGQGGYVVAPPSRHASGHPYRWIPGRDLEVPAGEVPTVLWERLQPRQLQRPTAPVQLPAILDAPGHPRAGGRVWPARLGAAGPHRRGWLALLPSPHRPRQRPTSRLDAGGLAGPGRLCGRPTQPPRLGSPLPVDPRPQPRGVAG